MPIDPPPGFTDVAPPLDPPGPSPPEGRQVVLLVDDEDDILESLRMLLVSNIQDLEVLCARSGREALEILEGRHVDLLVTDYKMPGMNGIELMAHARGIAPRVPRVLITAFPDLDVALTAINDAAVENFITKPLAPGYVITVVRTLLAEKRAQELRAQSFARTLELVRRRGPR